MVKVWYNTVKNFLSTPVKNRHLRYAVPFFVFMGIGLAVIRECASVRYLFRKSSTLDPEDVKRLEFLSEQRETLEEAYEKYQKIDIDNWENVRGPRLL